MRKWRPSAALVLGVLTGAVAAAMILPTAIPITRRIVELEDNNAREYAQNMASVASSRMDDAGTLPPELRDGMRLEALAVRAADGQYIHYSGTEGLDLSQVCTENPSPALGERDLQPACVVTKNSMAVIAVQRSDRSGSNQIRMMMLVLAIIVGIVTALGVLNILRPLSSVAKALDAVSAGERGIRVRPTGLSELDDIVERLNIAAASMEDREDEILARIRVVQEMARLVAHEVRNPLQSLELLTSLIVSEDSYDERKEIAEAIHTEIMALNDVVGRLLQGGAAGGALRLQRKMNSIAPIIEQISKFRSTEANAKGINFTQGPVSEREVSIDAALLGRSIENLILNAFQAVTPGIGHVHVTVFEQFPWLIIEVDDNGPGVHPEIGTHIFHADVTSKESGTGLGLPLVKGVVEAHGGTVFYEDSPLGGARFVVRLPLVDPTGPVEAS